MHIIIKAVTIILLILLCSLTHQRMDENRILRKIIYVLSFLALLSIIYGNNIYSDILWPYIYICMFATFLSFKIIPAIKFRNYLDRCLGSIIFIIIGLVIPKYYIALNSEQTTLIKHLKVLLNSLMFSISGLGGQAAIDIIDTSIYKSDTIKNLFQSVNAHMLVQGLSDTAVRDTLSNFLFEVQRYTSDLLLIFLLILEPILMTGILINLLGFTFSRSRYYFLLIICRMFNRKMYFFSEMNDNAVEIVNSGKGVIKNVVYYSHDSQNVIFDRKIFAKLKIIHSRKEIGKLDNFEISQLRNAEFFFISDDEKENYVQLSSFIDSLNNIMEKKKNLNGKTYIKIFLFDHEKTGSIYVDDIRNKVHQIEHFQISIYLINDVRSLCYNILSDNTYNIIEQINMNGKVATEKILLVGAGKLGREYLKAILSCSKLPDFNLSIYVIDKDMDNIRKELQLDCPELLFENENVHFYQSDVYSVTFSDALRWAGNDIDYVMVTLGNDRATMDAAIYLHNYFMEKRIVQNAELKKQNISVLNNKKIFVALRLYEQSNYDLIEEIKHSSYNNLDFHSYDKKHTVFNYDTLQKIVSSKIRYSNNVPKQYELDALDNKNLYVQYFKLYIKKMNIQQQVSSNLNYYLRFEHNRWITYLRSEGYKYVPVSYIDNFFPRPNYGHMNHALRLAPVLVSWEDLPAVEDEIRELYNNYNELEQEKHRKNKEYWPKRKILNGNYFKNIGLEILNSILSD